MGVFSEMAIGEEHPVQQNNPTGQDEVTPFVLESGNGEAETGFQDEERQQAEAEAAPAALAYLNGAGTETESSDDKMEPSEEQKRKAHEEQEAKRKAEWEAERRKKEDELQFAWETAVSVSDEELAQISRKKVGDDAERLTRRNMKICVTEHIQEKCQTDADFARYVMHPKKNMINCFRHITKKARAFAEQEMKDNGETPIGGGYGTDVPDDLCYKWAEEYFLDLEAEEDRDKEDKFVPRPYTGGSSRAKKSGKKAEKKAKPAPQKSAPEPSNEQMSLLEGA